MQSVKPFPAQRVRTCHCMFPIRLTVRAQAKDDRIKQHQREVEQLMGKQADLRQEDAELRKVKVCRTGSG